LPTLPINLATALRLADAQALEIALAGERVGVALGRLQQANALWLPTITLGVDYNRHDGHI
jgi:outer membrane protein TolC